MSRPLRVWKTTRLLSTRVDNRFDSDLLHTRAETPPLVTDRLRVRVTSPTLADRITAIRAEICALERQQRAHFLVTVASVVPGHVDFTAGELHALRDHHAALAAAFTELQIGNARSLGRRLQQIAKAGIDGAGLRLQRIGHDRGGVIWILR